MNYYIDTEFLEGTQSKTFLGFKYGHTKPTIDLISIGIVCEDGREYYAISKDFNLKEAWNRFQIEEGYYSGDIRNTLGDKWTKKIYWLRNNVLFPIWKELSQKEYLGYNGENPVDISNFTYQSLKGLIHKYGKTSKEIALDVLNFVHGHVGLGNWLGTTDSYYKTIAQSLPKNAPKFYGYYADYDWAVFCWLFGKMVDLPKGFPMYCVDLKQELDKKAEFMQLFYLGGLISEQKDRLCTFEEKLSRFKNLPNYPKNPDEHNALADARWNKQLHEFLLNL